MREEQLSILQIPLYKLLYLKEIADEPLAQRELELFAVTYGAEGRQRIMDGLRWAASHPEYPYSELLPEMPYSNQECHRYLVNVLRQLERQG